VDYTHNRNRGINVTHLHDDHDHSADSRQDDHHLRTRQDHQKGDRGEPEVFQGFQESLDNFVRQGIGDQEGDGGESEVSSRLQGKEERSKISGDHHDYDSPIPRVGPGLVRGLWSGGAN
jgi:hypothetical protein